MNDIIEYMIPIDHPSRLEWILEHLELWYLEDRVPESKEIGYDRILQLITNVVDNHNIYVVESSKGFVAATLSTPYNHIHIKGTGVCVGPMIGAGTDTRLTRVLVKRLLQVCKACGYDWIRLDHRIAEYTYKSKYYKLRYNNESESR